MMMETTDTSSVSSTQEQPSKHNAIGKCLEKDLEPENYAKFQQVLEYFHGEGLDMFYYQLYNDGITKWVTELQRGPLPNGFSFSQWVQYKIKFYSFRFIGNIGHALVQRINEGSDKAEEFYLNLTKVLFFHALTTKSYTGNLALVELEHLCYRRNLTLQSLYHNYRGKFLRLIIKAILKKLNDGIKESLNGTKTNGNGLHHDSNPLKKSNCVITYMTRALEVFSVTSITSEDVAQSLIIITNLIQKETYNDAIKLFLDSLASYQYIDIYTLVRSHIQAIMVSILLRRKLSHFDLTASLVKLSSFCDNKTPKELLATKFTFIKGRLLLHYSIDPKCVTEAIYYLSKFEKEEHDRPFEDEFEEEKNFIDYLNPSIIGILLGMDAHFTATRHDLCSTEGIKQIESLCKLISLLDQNQVETIHVKLLSTLSLLLQLRPARDHLGLNQVLVKVWEMFISKLKPELMTALVINICVGLYDLLEDIPEEVAQLYTNLICRDEPTLKPKLKSLFFIPNVPCLNQVYSYLTPHVRRNDTVTTLQDLQLSLECVLPLMKYENQKCRLIAITKTRQLLQLNQRLLTEKLLVNLDEPIESLISKTIESLLAVSSTQEAECSALIAECLGILGAINPIRLDHLIFGDMFDRETKFIYNLRSAEFAIDLIERLTSSLFSDQRSESETANYALQVVVKNYDVFKSRNPIRERLSKEALRACQLCQNTNYSGCKKAPEDLSNSVYEKFKSTNQYSYKDWLDRFSLHLTSTISDRRFQEVFHACSYIYRYNEKLAEFLLPLAMIHVILHQPGQSHVSVIKREIMAILDEDVGVSTQDLDTVYNEAARGNLQTLHFQCANLMFCSLDAINRLYSSSKLHRLKLGSQQSGHIKGFLDSIPKDRLAILASKCRSHTRALCYFEQHLFSNRMHPDKYATALQKIYVALDDTFEASGVEMVRTSPTTLKDDIAKYEACGKFNKALICCLTSLDIMTSEEDREPLIEDALRCLSNQGDYRRLHEISKHMMTEYSQCKRSILPYAIEASWKLGKWDELDYTFKNEQFEPLLESASVSQGYLLKSLMDPTLQVPSTLRTARHKLMKPLSIAMLDRSAYFRGYQNLLILHSIGDFDLTNKFITENRPAMLQLDENTADCLREPLLREYEVLIDLWGKRNQLVQPSLRSLEPLLVYQRALSLILKKEFPLLENKIDVDIGKTWLSSADAAREARSFDRSFYCLAQAQRWFGSIDKLALDLRVKFHIEQAKLEWELGEQTKAIRGLKLCLERLKDHRIYEHLAERHIKKIATPAATDVFPQLNKLTPCEDCSFIRTADRKSFSDLKMLLTQYSEEAAAGIPETLLDMYEECVHLGVNQEETYFRLARYYDKLLNYYMDNPQLCCEQIEDRHDLEPTQRFSQNIRSGDREDVYTRLMEHSIIAFGNSLRYGVRYLRESMPRLLNIWYDLGQRKFIGNSKQNSETKNRSVSGRIESTVRFISELKANLPPYYFMTAISLLLSRICHPHSGVAKKTSEIIELLLTNYPHQMIWQMISALEDKEDTAQQRQKAANDILRSIKNKKNLPAVETIIAHTKKFAEILNEVCINNSPSDKRPADLRKKLSSISNLADVSKRAAEFKFDKFKVIAPVEASIRAILPMHDAKDGLEKHVVFPQHNMSYVREIAPQVRVFNSMQQPRAIKLKLENGRAVTIICKSGDDLRKDSRCIEFLNLLNRILRRDNQSNARYIEIQTFLVLPLSSYTGLIELVPNCESLKSIVEPMYKQRGMTVQNFMPKVALPDYHNTFIKEVLPKFCPPVLPEWFLRRFTEPTSWYMARLAFTRSTAVASMGGYIIGLGDRHLDNMLIDIGTGRVVHVDFNLLFHQGESLPTPEVVPFRLTQNLIASFGSLGTEGNFRKVCEITMRVMRKEKDALLTTLKPIIHDPCSEWIKARDYRDAKLARGDENKTAKSRIETTERKLKGYPRSKKFKPLTLIDSYSVDAQVENLIEEASDTQNLSKMYFGWCPYV